MVQAQGLGRPGSVGWESSGCRRPETTFQPARTAPDWLGWTDGLPFRLGPARLLAFHAFTRHPAAQIAGAPEGTSSVRLLWFGRNHRNDCRLPHRLFPFPGNYVLASTRSCAPRSSRCSHSACRARVDEPPSNFPFFTFQAGRSSACSRCVRPGGFVDRRGRLPEGRTTIGFFCLGLLPTAGPASARHVARVRGDHVRDHGRGRRSLVPWPRSRSPRSFVAVCPGRLPAGGRASGAQGSISRNGLRRSSALRPTLVTRATSRTRPRLESEPVEPPGRRGHPVPLRFIPNAHTDFIFAGRRALRIRWRGAGLIPFRPALLAGGCASEMTSANLYGRLQCRRHRLDAIIFQVFTKNVGMNLGIMPITGIPLPLMSYGVRSSPTMLAIGVLRSRFTHGVTAAASHRTVPLDRTRNESSNLRENDSSCRRLENHCCRSADQGRASYGLEAKTAKSKRGRGLIERRGPLGRQIYLGKIDNVPGLEGRIRRRHQAGEERLPCPTRSCCPASTSGGRGQGRRIDES